MIVPTLSPALEYSIISSIIDAVGRDIILSYVSTRTVCTVCGSTDPFCSTCHGNQTVDVLATKTVKANIRWKGSDQKIYRPEGQFVDGDCLVDFVTDVAEGYEALDILLKKVISVTVDNRTCVIKNWFFEGSPINRVNLVLLQDTDIGGQRIG